MARQSQKRNQQRNEVMVGYLRIACLVITAIYLLSEVWFGGLFSVKGGILFIVLTGLNFICYKQIIKCWDYQLPPEAYEYYIDILGLNLIVQLLSPLTSYVWYLYWSIPLFLFVLFAKWFWRWITPEYVPEETEDDKKKKKQGQDDKDKKPKVKYVKA